MSDNDDLLNKIYVKVEKMDDKLGSIDITTVKQQVILDEHIKRTLILENRTEKIFEELKPIKQHVSMVDGIVKVVIGGIALISTILGILRLFGKI